jgi:hypothetical protein
MHTLREILPGSVILAIVDVNEIASDEIASDDTIRKGNRTLEAAGMHHTGNMVASNHGEASALEKII